MSIADIVESVVDGPLPLRFEAYDGSAAGPPEAALDEETLLRQATEFYLRHCQQDTRTPSP